MKKYTVIEGDTIFPTSRKRWWKGKFKTNKQKTLWLKKLNDNSQKKIQI